MIPRPEATTLRFSQSLEKVQKLRITREGETSAASHPDLMLQATLRNKLQELG